MFVLGEKESAKVRSLAQKFGIESIKLFGSRATGISTDSSDYDFLVRFGGVASLVEIIGFKQEVEQLLGCPVDVVEEGGIPVLMRDRILSEAIAI